MPKLNGPKVGVKSGADQRLPSQDIQQLWLEVQQLKWSSLVVVPADPGGTATSIASSLAKAGTMLSDVVIRVLNAEGMGPAFVAELIANLSSHRASATGTDPRRILISIESVLTNPLGIGIAKAADAVLLCVRKRRTKLAAARKTVDLIGRERVIASVVLSDAR